MTHRHLSLDRSCGLNSNADDDQKRRSAESEVVERCIVAGIRDSRDEHRYAGNDAEEASIDEGDAVKDLCDKVGSRFAGTLSGDRSAVLL